MQSKNYRFEILSFLAKNPGTITDIGPLIDDFVKEGHYSVQYLTILLQSMRNNQLLWFNDEISLFVMTGDNEVKPCKIAARIEPDGIAEYKRLKKRLAGQNK